MMNVIEIMREFGKMCSIEGERGCSGCGLSCELNGTGETCENFIAKHPEEAVRIIERWEAEHPKKTRQSEFLKMFPNASIVGGVPEISPCHVDNKFSPQKGCGTSSCADCRKEYWNEEVE